MGWDEIKKMPAAGLREELRALLAKEAEYAHAPPRPPPANPQGAVEEEPGVPNRGDRRLAAIRQQVCQWNYDTVDYFLVSREVVHLSMNYFDRYLAARQGKEGGPLTAKMSHLLALASLYLACKCQGATAASDCSQDDVRLRLKDFCKMSGGAYSPRMIEGMELTLLAALRWRLHPPTPTDFLYRFAKLLWLSSQDSDDDDEDDQQPHGQDDALTEGEDAGGDGGWSAFELARYQIELAAYSPQLCQACPPSVVALAAVLNATDSRLAGTDRVALPPRVRRAFLRRLRRLGEGFGGDRMEAAVQRAQVVLKTLCPETIALPRPEAESVASPLEYELSKDQSLVDESISPVGVDSDCL